MLPKTRDYLDAADRNRDFARDVGNTFAETRPSLEWAAVIAFYAAVHYVNAYRWERLQLEPRGHDERDRLIATVRDLRPILGHYRILQDHAFTARYRPTYRIALADLQDVLDKRLATIEREIRVLVQAV